MGYVPARGEVRRWVEAHRDPVTGELSQATIERALASYRAAFVRPRWVARLLRVAATVPAPDAGAGREG